MNTFYLSDIENSFHIKFAALGHSETAATKKS